MKGDESRNQKSVSLVVLQRDKSQASHCTFGASVASDAGAFADEVLVAGFVVGVDDGRDAVEGPFQFKTFKGQMFFPCILPKLALTMV